MTPLEEIRHSASHVLATAVLRIFPQAQLDIGPPTETGFYYDFDLEHRFTQEDLEKLEAEMKKIIKEDQKFVRSEIEREAAKKLFIERNQPYKIGRIDDIPEGEAVSLYQNGEFIDLCGGTHVSSTGKIKAVKLLTVAAAYHRGNEKNKQLQRIYGTAFPSEAELDEYLKQVELAKERDHRKLGKTLELFAVDDAVGQGLVLWMPKGAIIRQELQTFISEELFKQGYQQVFTPHIGRLGLYKTSGHFPYYRESQFPPIIENDHLEKIATEGCSCGDLMNQMEKGDLEGFLLKPMNCPMHIRIFAQRPHSYREMPIRFAEFGTVYRWEQSGELGGMTRVRGFTQDDAHLFVTEEQLAQEVQGCLELVKKILSTLGMNDYRVRVSLRDPDSTKYVGDAANWEKAEQALRDAASNLGVPFVEAKGEAAFYGPKIDFIVKDVIGREWQLGTVQVDYNLPERFNLQYTGADNKPHRPIMIHRAPFGSLERFCGILIEHFGGAFPVWLAPEQIRFLTISDNQNAYAQSLHDQCVKLGLRSTIDLHPDKIGAKIRRAQLEKVSYMLVIGAKEAEANAVAVRSRAKGDEGVKPFAEFLERIQREVKERTLVC